MRFSIRQLLALTLIVGLSVQAYLQRREVASIEARYRAWANETPQLEGSLRPLRQQTDICQMLVKDWPYLSEDYLTAKERYGRLDRGLDAWPSRLREALEQGGGFRAFSAKPGGSNDR